ncbi:MAG: large conductance mechanosensitive channel protein MscL [Clostridia bacterium]|nr:large conductance mechanosensitive channel protein MscL [Clostridia bacterium]
MKKFTNEFKTFVNRGNVVDMAVGVIVGTAFTAIVNAVTNNILTPLINWLISMIFDADSLSEIYTYLKTVYVVDEAGIVTEEIDLAQSIYINWGLFITAVLNFFLIAAVLFCIVKIINKLRKEHKEFAQKISDKTLDRAERKELKAAGVNIRDKKAVEAYYLEKQRLAAEKQAAEAAAAAEADRLARLANPTTEDLLKLILAELREKK